MNKNKVGPASGKAPNQEKKKNKSQTAQNATAAGGSALNTSLVVQNIAQVN